MEILDTFVHVFVYIISQFFTVDIRAVPASQHLHYTSVEYIYNTFSTYTVFFTRHSCSRCKYLLYVQGFVCTSIRAADLLINLVRTGSMAEENTLEIQNHLKKEDVVRVFTMVALYCRKSIHLSSFQLLNEYVCLKVIFFVFSINLFARKQKRSLW